MPSSFFRKDQISTQYKTNGLSTLLYTFILNFSGIFLSKITALTFLHIRHASFTHCRTAFSVPPSSFVCLFSQPPSSEVIFISSSPSLLSLSLSLSFLIHFPFFSLQAALPRQISLLQSSSVSAMITKSPAHSSSRSSSCSLHRHCVRHTE